MRKRLTTRLGAAGIGALVVLAVAASPAYGLTRPAEPVPPAGLTGLEPTGADMPTVGGNLGNQHYSGLTQITKREPEGSRTRLAHARVGGRAGHRRHRAADHPHRRRRGDLPRHAERRRDRRRRRDGRSHLEVGERRLRPVGHASRRLGRRRQDLHAGGRQPRRRARQGHGRGGLGGSSPPARTGEDLGRVGKVATVYYDGIVYAHAADGDRGAVVALDASDGSYLWHFFGGPKRGQEFTGVDGVTFDASETWGPGAPRRHRLRRGGRRDVVDARRGGSRAGHVLHDLRQRPQLHVLAERVPPARRQPVLEHDGGGGCRDRRVQVALPVDPPRRVGHGQRAPADTGRHRGRTARSGRSSSTAASRATSSCWIARTASRCFP